MNSFIRLFEDFAKGISHFLGVFEDSQNTYAEWNTYFMAGSKVFFKYFGQCAVILLFKIFCKNMVCESYSAHK